MNEIRSIGSGAAPLPGGAPGRQIGASDPTSFGDTLKAFVTDVNDVQADAGEAVNRLLTGEIKDLHDVQIAMQKAGTSFELMMEIRNRMIEAYREVMRMQV